MGPGGYSSCAGKTDSVAIELSSQIRQDSIEPSSDKEGAISHESLLHSGE